MNPRPILPLGTRVLSGILAGLMALPAQMSLALADSIVTRWVINDGDPSRSRVTNFSFTLSNGLVPAPGGVSVRRQPNGPSLDGTNLFLTSLDGSNAYRVAFTNLPGSQLPDGNYLASVVAVPRTNLAGPRRSDSLPLFSWLGDSDGDRDVDFLDTFRFRSTWLLGSHSPGFDLRFDANADGRVDTNDLAPFQSHYFTLLPPEPGVFAHLVLDDGLNPGDGVTSDPHVAGQLVRSSPTQRLRGALAAPGDPEPDLTANLADAEEARGRFQLSPGRLAALAGGTLSGGVDYVLHLGLVETNGVASARFQLPFRVQEDCPLTPSGWDLHIAATGGTNQPPGSATFENCELILAEGDSFLVAAERTLAIPPGAEVLTFSYLEPDFDRSVTHRMRDALEAALVDEQGRPLTFTVQGAQGTTPASVQNPAPLPPVPDTFFNHSEGLPAVAAPGAVVLGQADGRQKVVVHVGNLPRESRIRLILRLVNNDRDRSTVVRITDVGFENTLPAGLENGVNVPAFPALTGPGAGPAVPPSVGGGSIPVSSLPGLAGTASTPPSGSRAIARNADTPCTPLSGPVTNAANGHVYYLLPQSNWTKAEQMAQCLGGHLATIRNAGENEFVFTNFSTFGNEPRGLWIGYNDLQSEGNFQWVSGETASYSNWNPGEPNNSFWFGGESYTHIWDPRLAPHGTWNDAADLQEVPFGEITMRFFGVAEIIPAPAMDQISLTVATPLDGATIPVGSVMLQGNAAASGTGMSPPRRIQWTFDGFNGAATNLDLLDMAKVEATATGSPLVLSPSGPNSGGGAFLKDAVPIKEFSTHFVFRISDAGSEPGWTPGADGMVFMVTDRLPSALPTAGGGLGLLGLTNSVAVEVDTWQNFHDPDSNHIGIIVEGDLWHDATRVLAPVPGEFADGRVRYMWVDYDGAVLEIRISDDPQKPMAPLLRHAVDVASLVGSELARVGFAATSGSAAWEKHELLSWEFEAAGDGTVTRAEGLPIAVSVNGQPVEAIDAAGNFFSMLNIAPGPNRFEVVASDGGQLRATNVLTVFGTRDPQTLASLGEVSASVIPEYGRTSFNEWTQVVYADLALRNAGTFPIRNPFYVGVTRISDPAVQLLAPDGMSADGIAYYDFSAALTAPSLNPGQQSLPRTLAFHNPEGRQFTYDLVVLGQLNRAPGFTTTPVLEVISGKSYTYAFNATDPDGDLLKYSLATGPGGLTLNSQLQTLNWLPSATNLGNHDIRLRSEDGKGGMAEQRYLLSVIDQQSNRPPHFVSVPITVARVAPKGSVGECLPLPSGISAWWPGDGSAADLVNGNDGIQRNGLSATNLGIVRQAFEFDGVDDYVVIPSSTNLALQTFTIAGWIFPTDLGASRPIFEWAAETGWAGVHVWQSTREEGVVVLTGSIQVNLRDDRDLGLESSHTLATPGDVLKSYQWNHIAVIYNKPTGIVTIVVNGIRQAEKYIGNDFNLKTSVPLLFGRRPENSADGSAGASFSGLMDEVLLYNRALSIEEIASIHAIGSAGTCQSGITSVVGTYQYPAAAIDPDRDVLTYSLAHAPTNMSINPATGLITWKPSSNQIGDHEVTVEVSDGRGGEATQSFRVCVREPIGNRSPVFVSTPPREACRSGLSGEKVVDVLVPYLSDGYLYQVVPNGSVPGFEQPSFEESGFNLGEAGFGSGSCDLNDIQFTRTPWPANTDLLVRRHLLLSGRMTGLKIKVAIDNDIEVFFNGVNVSGGRQIHEGCPSRDSFTFDVPSDLILPGDNLIAVRAIDRGTWAYFDMEVYGEEAPAVFRHVAKAVDPDGDPVRYRLGMAPAGASLDPESGLIGWLAEQVSEGDHLFEVIAEDGRGGTSRQAFVVRIARECVPGVRGIVWNDLNGNGTRDSGALTIEPGLGGRVVFADINADSRRDPDEPAAITASTGAFELGNLPTGNYFLRLEPKRGWYQTFPVNGGSLSVGVVSGQTATIAGFGVATGAEGEGNEDPQYLTQAPSTVTASQGWQYPVFVHDADGDPLEFDLVAHPDGMLVDSGTGVVSWHPEPDQVGRHDVILRARDGRGGIALQSFTITVLAPNTAPILLSSLPPVAVVGNPYTLQLEAQDAEHQVLTFAVTNPPAGLAVNPTNGILTWTPTLAQVGTNLVDLSVADPGGAIGRWRLAIEVLPTAVNQAPVFVSAPRTQSRVDLPYLYEVRLTDPDADPVSLELTRGAAGMALVKTVAAADGTTRAAPFQGAFLQWQPTAGQVGEHEVTLRASDGRGGAAEQRFVVRVGTTLSNSTPLIVSSPPLAATTESIFIYDPVATDPDGDDLTWRLVNGPLGVSLNPETGALRWVPNYDQLGTNQFVVEAQDPFLGVDRQSFTVVVGCVNEAPRITSVPPIAASAETTYLYAPRASDPNGDPLAWSLGSRPTGMTMDATTGLIRWVPGTNQTGVHTVQVQVTDSRGGFDTQTYTLQVNDRRANRSPVITSAPVLGVAAGRPYAYAVRATDADGDSLSLELLAGPGGATLTPGRVAAGEAEARVSWTPTEAGRFEFIVAAKDNRGASAAQRFFVTVRANEAPFITSTPRTNAVPGIVYRYDLAAADPNGDVLGYALEAAPAGMSISPLGQVAWSPAFSDVGEARVTVLVTDGFGGEARQSFNVTVAADNQPPAVRLEVGYNLVDEAGGRLVEAGTTIRLRVTATDNVGVAAQSLRVGGQPVALNAGGYASVPFPQGGTVEAVAEARDAAGNVGSRTERIRVVDLRAEGDVAITLHSPTNSAVLTRPTEVVASLTSSQPLSTYLVEYAELTSEVPGDDIPVGDPRLVYRTLSQGSFPPGTTNVVRAVLGRFDPTRLPNGGYLIRVSAYDQNGQGRQEGAAVEVTGQLKFGEFRMEFTDLQIPVAGIPITVRRVYDSRDSSREGDFGYGWSMAVAEPRILETGKKQGAGFDDTTLTVRSRVYLTGPDGRRVGFRLAPEPRAGGIFGATYFMRFRGDPGVYDTLEVDDEGGWTKLADGSIGLAVGAGIAGFDPATYRLRTRDGLVYHYDQSLGLRRVTDLNGNQLTFDRDGIRHSLGQRIDFRRDARGRITQIIDPAGNSLRYEYDGRGDLRAFTDQATNITRYAYDTVRPHFLTNIIDPFGKPALGLVYDETGRLKEVRDAIGNPLKQDFDPDANVGTFTDARGNQTIVRFDDQGNETLRIVPGISTNRFAYDHNNNLTNAINARGYATNFTYDARGNVTSITDALTNTTRVAYNELSKPVAVTNALNQVILLQYDASGQLTNVINNQGHATRMTRDSLGRVTSVTDAANQTARFDYEGGCACGRPGKVINPDGTFRLYEYNALGQTNRIINELGAETRFEFDSTGRLLWAQDALGNRVTYGYSGPRLETITDALGRVTRFGYDDRGRTNRITDPEGGVARLAYDANGNRTEVTDPVGNTTRFVYDSANRLIHQVDPLGHTNFFAYDPAGNRIETIDRNGRRRTFAYDAQDRMTNEVWWEGTNVVRSIAFAFNELGIQTLASDPAARYEYRYDTLNRLEEVVARSEGVPDFTLRYTYTSIGQVESVTDNWGVHVGSAYDNRNRIATRTWQGPGMDPARVDFAYDPTGNRIHLDRFADLAGTVRVGRTTNAYNRVGILTNITHLGPTNQTLARYDYQVDPAYQITRWAIGDQISEFGYDRTGQLTNALNTVLPSENFRYDANGNRIGPQSGGDYLVGGNNQILSDGTNRYTYDPEGTMTSRSNTVTGVLTTYQWDHRNRLVSVQDRNPAGVVSQKLSFVYDAMSRRLVKTANGQTNRFLYNGVNLWSATSNDAGSMIFYMHGQWVDEVFLEGGRGRSLGWYLADHLGSTRCVASVAGSKVEYLQYSAFGSIIRNPDDAPASRQLFAGREYDSESGLYCLRNRYYSPALGRFLSQDPRGFSGRDLNLARYVYNTPLLARDPFGTIAMFEYAKRVHEIMEDGKARLSTRVVEQNPLVMAGAIVGFVHGFGLANLSFMSHALGGADFVSAYQSTVKQVASAKDEICNVGGSFGGGPGLSSGEPGGFVGGFCGGWIDFRIKVPLTKEPLLIPGITTQFGGFDQGSQLGLEHIRNVIGLGN